MTTASGAVLQTTRRERERNQRRSEIIDAARAVFGAKGFANATLDDVALRAEFGKGTLYNYFESKEALFVVVLQDSFETLMGIARDSLQAGVPFAEKVDRFVRGSLTYFFHNLEWVQLILREAYHLRMSNPLMHLMPQLLQLLADTIAAEQRRRKIIGSVEAIGLASVLFNLIIGQFNARVYRCAASGSESREEVLAEIFGRMTDAEIQAEVDAAARIITTVYFNGISK